MANMQGTKGKERIICRLFIRNRCSDGDSCRFFHPRYDFNPDSSTLSWLNFCTEFKIGRCFQEDCRFFHVTREEEDAYRLRKDIAPALLEQAMRKALILDVALTGTRATCKGFLQGECSLLACPYRHISRNEFANEVLNTLRNEFVIVLGTSGSDAVGMQSLHSTQGNTMDNPQIRGTSMLSVMAQSPLPDNMNKDEDTSELMKKLEEENLEIYRALDPNQKANSLEEIRSRLLTLQAALQWKDENNSTTSSNNNKGGLTDDGPLPPEIAAADYGNDDQDIDQSNIACGHNGQNIDEPNVEYIHRKDAVPVVTENPAVATDNYEIAPMELDHGDNHPEEEGGRCQVFVGGLDRGTQIKDLENYFSRYGEIVDAIVNRDKKNLRSRGFGFVTFLKSYMAENAVRGGPHKIDGKIVEAKFTNPKTADDDGRPRSAGDRSPPRSKGDHGSQRSAGDRGSQRSAGDRGSQRSTRGRGSLRRADDYSPQRFAGDYSPPRSTGDYSPPRSTGDYNPPRSAGDYSPPRSTGDYSPPRYADDYGPARYADNYSPPRYTDDYGPPRYADDFGPPQLVGDFGPPQLVGDFGPPQLVGDFGPPMLAGDFGPPMLAGDFGPPMLAGDRSPPRWIERDPIPNREELIPKLFVGGLSDEITTKILADYFEQYGPIVDAVSMQDPKTKRQRGFGFVEYAEEFSLQKALANAPHTVYGCRVSINRSMPRDSDRRNNPGPGGGGGVDGRRYANQNTERKERLSERPSGVKRQEPPSHPEASTAQNQMFIGRIRKTVRKDDIKDYFMQYGDVKRVDLLLGRDKTYRYGFVTFEEPEMVDIAVSSAPHEIDGFLIETGYANPKKEAIPIKEALPKKGKDKGPTEEDTSNRKIKIPKEHNATNDTYQPCNLFVGNLSLDVTEETLYDHFCKYGEIKGTDVKLDHKGISRGFGFVIFVEDISVQEALEDGPHEIDGIEVIVARGKDKRDGDRQHERNQENSVLTSKRNAVQGRKQHDRNQETQSQTSKKKAVQKGSRQPPSQTSKRKPDQRGRQQKRSIETPSLTSKRRAVKRSHLD